MERRDGATVGDRTTNVVEKIAVSPDEEVLRLPPKHATSLYTLNPSVTTSQSERTEPNGKVTHGADHTVSGSEGQRGTYTGDVLRAVSGAAIAIGIAGAAAAGPLGMFAAGAAGASLGMTLPRLLSGRAVFHPKVNRRSG